MKEHRKLWRRQLLDGASQLGLQLTALQVEQLLDYLTLLEKWNRAYNLTAIRDPAELVPRHLLDSLSILPWADGERLLDIGTGAGLPGIPLAIALPGLSCTLLDSNGKKVRFVRQVAMELKLRNVEVEQSRVETYASGVGFDRVCARALASLEDLVKRTAPLLVEGGVLLAMKGAVPKEEIVRLSAEGYALEVIPLRVPLQAGERHLIRWSNGGEAQVCG